MDMASQLPVVVAPLRPLLTVPEAAGLLHISERTTWRLVRDGEIPVVRIRKRIVRVDPAAIAAYLAAPDGSVPPEVPGHTADCLTPDTTVYDHTSRFADGPAGGRNSARTQGAAGAPAQRRSVFHSSPKRSEPGGKAEAVLRGHTRRRSVEVAPRGASPTPAGCLSLADFRRHQTHDGRSAMRDVARRPRSDGRFG
ncbi:MAG: helix-turn-helix domain-containing protein [Candidatus Limnocylindrales bacterium]